MSRHPAKCYVGLGANLGDAAGVLRQAIEDCGRIPQTRVAACSSLYRSAPLGYLDQPDFFNAVACLETCLSAPALLHRLQAIEQRHGRTREFRNAPRTLDLDLLVHGKTRLTTPELVLPHPRMHERRFVLEPLLEIAPDLVIDGRGRVSDLLQRCLDQPVTRITPE